MSPVYDILWESGGGPRNSQDLEHYEIQVKKSQSLLGSYQGASDFRGTFAVFPYSRCKPWGLVDRIVFDLQDDIHLKDIPWEATEDTIPSQVSFPSDKAVYCHELDTIASYITDKLTKSNCFRAIGAQEIWLVFNRLLRCSVNHALFSFNWWIKIREQNLHSQNQYARWGWWFHFEVLAESFPSWEKIWWGYSI